MLLKGLREKDASGTGRCGREEGRAHLDAEGGGSPPRAPPPGHLGAPNGIRLRSELAQRWRRAHAGPV